MAKNTIEPTMQTRKKIMSIITDYVRAHKRKVYGGVAINALVRAKSPTDAFYDDTTDVADIDFYTPYPVQDIQGICDALRDSGIKFVEGKEAQHVETFTIHATYWKCCDISYVQSAVYKKIPVVEMDDGMVYTHPNFMFIDFLRILNDPLTSYFRLDKSFPRFTKLHQLYPLEGPSRHIDVHRAATDVFGSPATERNKKIRIARRVLLDFIPKSNAVIIGMNAYNSIMDLAAVKGFHGAVNAPSPFNNAILIEVLTTEFAKDVAALYDLLISEVPDVQYTEYHPFYDFLGHRGQFSLPRPRQTGGPGDDDPVVLRVFDNKHKCVPFMVAPMAVPPLGGGVPSGANAGETTIQAKIGTFTVTVMYLMVMRFRVRVENRNKNIDAITVVMYDNMIANLYGARAAFLSSTGKTLLDNTPFKEFVLPCVGDALHALRINHMVQEERFRRYRQRGLKYNPDRSRTIDKYQFSNSSGNIINNSRDRFFNPPGTETTSNDDGEAPPSSPTSQSKDEQTNASQSRRASDE